MGGKDPFAAARPPFPRVLGWGGGRLEQLRFGPRLPLAAGRSPFIASGSLAGTGSICYGELGI